MPFTKKLLPDRCVQACQSECTHWNNLGNTTGGVWLCRCAKGKCCLRKSYLSEDETGGRGAAIRPLESTSPGIGSSIHLKKETERESAAR